MKDEYVITFLLLLLTIFERRKKDIIRIILHDKINRIMNSL